MYKADVVVIGAGASGLSAAYHIAKTTGGKAVIYVLEHKDKPAKKILASGNGRCNFTNDVIDKESFRGHNPCFAYNLVKKYDKEWLISFFRELGIVHTCINGYYYPHSLQAATVGSSFISALNRYNVHLITGAHADNIYYSDERYIVTANDVKYSAAYVVLALGGKSYTPLGADGSGYKLAKNMGHKVTDTFPALCGLVLKGINFKRASGVRAKGNVKLIRQNKIISESSGELQFTDYGLSGIPVFQISRYAADIINSGASCELRADIVPDYREDELFDIISEIIHNNPERTFASVLNAFIPIKLSEVLIHDLNIKNVHDMCSGIKNIYLTVKDTMSFDKAQVTAGGVDVCEIENDTMQSKFCNRLYITGELLDIDGNCGGYNLHFAFASGACAGIHIGGRITDGYKNKPVKG